MNLVKPFKLVPLHMFEKMAAGGTGCDPANIVNNNNNNNDEDGSVNNNNEFESSSSSRRSIKNIIESDIDNNKSHFKPSTHFVAEFNSAIPNQQQQQQAKMPYLKGKGISNETATSTTTNNNNTPLFLPGTDELPEHSKGAMIKKKYDNIVDILNDSSIPESLKLKLYLLLRSKYDKARNMPDTDIDEMSSDTSNMSALTNAGSTMPKNKQADVKKLIDILSMQDYLSWDMYGNIISSIPGSSKFDLTHLMKMILYKDYGDQNDLVILSKLIRPYINKMVKQQIVHNERLLDTPLFKGYHKTERQSRYMPW